VKAKRKTTHPKQDWQANRKPYTWHLRPPCAGKFDRSHWWKRKPDIDPVAALYELARRHPSVGLRMTQPWKLENPVPAIVCLGDFGLKSWPNLSPGHQAMWKSFAGNLKGVDSRNDDEKCFDIVWQNEGEPLNQVITLQRGIALPTADELEVGIARRAIAAYRKGFLLIAVAPDLAEEKAQDLFVNKYREHRIMDGTVKQRARPGNWLDLIAAFEDEEARPGGGKSKSFNSYKKVVDSLHFQ